MPMAYRAQMCCLVAFCVAGGCAASPNNRYFYKDNAKLFGIMNSANRWHKLEYISLTVDMSKPSHGLTSRIGIGPSAERMVALKDVDFALLSKCAKPTPEHDLMSGDLLPIEEEATYALWDYYFTVKKGKVVMFDVGTGEPGKPQILWDIEHKKPYTMPLSQEDAIDLFGVPDRQEDTFGF